MTVRRFALGFILLAAMLDCRRHDPDRFDWVLAHYDAAVFSSRVDLADPATAKQRLFGFFPVQQKSWCWTEPRFALLIPAHGSRLRMHFFLPPNLIEQEGRLTVQAFVDGVALPPETYSTDGDHEYARALDRRTPSTPVRVEVALDHAFVPGPKGPLYGLVFHWASIEP
jgi:hypothetical protein